MGGFNTEDQDEWLWGLKHFVKFDSFVASEIGDDPTLQSLFRGMNITPEVMPFAEPELRAVAPSPTVVAYGPMLGQSVWEASVWAFEGETLEWRFCDGRGRKTPIHALPGSAPGSPNISRPL